jgi:hypothetical protein
MEDVGIFYGHWVYFAVIWYIFPVFGMLYQEKSGNPDSEAFSKALSNPYCIMVM